MSLLLSQLGAVVAPDQFWPTETDLASLQTDSDEIELSFSYGPLSADAAIVDDAVYSAGLEEAPEAEQPEGDFVLSLQDEFIIHAGQQDELPEALDEGFEPEFTLSLQDDFVVVADTPYQHFDEYPDVADAEYDFSFYIGAIQDAEVAPEPPPDIPPGYYSLFDPLRYRTKRKQEEEEAEPRLDVKIIAKGTPREVNTGIVYRTKARSGKPAPDYYATFAARKSESDKTRREHIARVLKDDDEWFMMS